MIRKDFSPCIARAILPTALACVLSLSMQASAQEFELIGTETASTTPHESTSSYDNTVALTDGANSTIVITDGCSCNNLQPTYRLPAPTYSLPPASINRFSSQSRQAGLAQSKAVQAARMRLRGHIGGGLGGAKYEGVGWSNQSPQAAIEQCCYWGTRPTAQIGVSKGQDGCWYACVLYH